MDGGVSPHNNPALMLVMLASLKGYGFNWPLGEDRFHIDSVGAGEIHVRPSAASLKREPAAMLAMRSLMSLMNDCGQLNQMVLQWMSDSAAPQALDAEVGDLSGDLLSGKPLIGYRRYNATLSKDWLTSELGLSVTEKEAAMLQRMDAPHAMDLLLDIGRRAAARQVLKG